MVPVSMELEDGSSSQNSQEVAKRPHEELLGGSHGNTLSKTTSNGVDQSSQTDANSQYGEQSPAEAPLDRITVALRSRPLIICTIYTAIMAMSLIRLDRKSSRRARLNHY